MLSLKYNKKELFSLMVLFFFVVCGCHSAASNPLLAEHHSKREFRDGYIIGLAAGYALSIDEFKYNPEFLKSITTDWHGQINLKDEMKLRVAENKDIEKEIEKEYDDYVKNDRKI